MLSGTMITIDLADVENADAVGEMLVQRLPASVTSGIRFSPRADPKPFVTLHGMAAWTPEETAAVMAMASRHGIGQDGWSDDGHLDERLIKQLISDPGCAGITSEGLAYVRWCDGDTTLALRIISAGLEVVNHDAKKDYGWQFVQKTMS